MVDILDPRKRPIPDLVKAESAKAPLVLPSREVSCLADISDKWFMNHLLFCYIIRTVVDNPAAQNFDPLMDFIEATGIKPEKIIVPWEFTTAFKRPEDNRTLIAFDAEKGDDVKYYMEGVAFYHADQEPKPFFARCGSQNMSITCRCKKRCGRKVNVVMFGIATPDYCMGYIEGSDGILRAARAPGHEKLAKELEHLQKDFKLPGPYYTSYPHLDELN